MLTLAVYSSRKHWKCEDGKLEFSPTSYANTPIGCARNAFITNDRKPMFLVNAKGISRIQLANTRQFQDAKSRKHGIDDSARCIFIIFKQ